MSMERVLVTTDTVGGVWTFTLELAGALSARGFEVILVAFGGKASSQQRTEAARLPGLCLLDCDFKLEWMDDPWADVEASGRWLQQITREYSPSLIHLNSFGHGALVWNAPVILTVHSCVFSWWRAVKAERAPRTWERYGNLVKSSLNSVDLVTVPSCAMASALHREYGWDPLACTVIPNARTASALCAASKEPFILTAGRLWDEAKNAQAVAGIAQKLSWPVYLAGDAQGHQFAGCNVLGQLPAPQLAAWMSRASIFALPARYEPFGLSILEAALSGCALVLGDIPSLREIWRDAAVYADPGDGAALREALESLISDAAYRAKLAGRAAARALTFDTDTFADSYLQAYEHAVSLRSSQCRSRQCVS